MERQTATKNKQESINSSSLSRGILQRKCACGNQAAGGGECGECGKKNQLLQRRAIHISEPGDRYEQEADRIANQVMRMPEPTAKHQVGSEKEGVLQRKAIANSITPLQPGSAGQEQVSEVPPIVDEVLRSQGQSLAPETRAFMEPRFGHDFSQVRVHTDAKAAESAFAIKALAYTVRNNIVFGKGKHSPQSKDGNQLLAHELTHVVQQEPAPDQGKLKIAHPQESLEQQADSVALAVAANQPIGQIIETTHSSLIQRDAGGGTPPKYGDIDVDLLESFINAGNWEFAIEILETHQQDDNRVLAILVKLKEISAPSGQSLLELLIKNKPTALPDRLNSLLLRAYQSVIVNNSTELSSQTAINKSATQALALKNYALSESEITIVKANEKQGITEIKESPAYYANQILRKAGIDSKTWFSSFTSINFLGRSVADIHKDLATHLQAVEQKFAQEYGGDKKDPKVAGEKLGLEEDIGGARHTPTSAVFSMHLFGLAIDVNYKSNPFISTSANPVFERAGQLINGKKMEYKNGMSYSDIAGLDKVLEIYFSYIDDRIGLEAKLKEATGFWQDKSVDDAQVKIKQDLSLVAGKWERAKSLEVIQKGGFLNLKEELVQGFELSWGGSYGDMMHFDMRNKGNGAKINAAIEQYKKEKETESRKKGAEE